MALARDSAGPHGIARGAGRWCWSWIMGVAANAGCLAAGQSHTVHLVAPEDSAMIETYDGVPGFRVALRNCTPQPLPE